MTIEADVFFDNAAGLHVAGVRLLAAPRVGETILIDAREYEITHVQHKSAPLERAERGAVPSLVILVRDEPK